MWLLPPGWQHVKFIGIKSRADPAARAAVKDVLIGTAAALKRKKEQNNLPDFYAIGEFPHEIITKAELAEMGDMSEK